jgi:hypothetical protein
MFQLDVWVAGSSVSVVEPPVFLKAAIGDVDYF